MSEMKVVDKRRGKMITVTDVKFNWAKVIEPETVDYNKNPIDIVDQRYSVEVVVDKATMESLDKICQTVLKEAHDQRIEDIKADASKKGGWKKQAIANIKLEPKQFKELYDESGETVIGYGFKANRKAYDKNGVPVPKPIIVDSKNTPLTSAIGNDSTGKIKFLCEPYTFGEKVGVKCTLNAMMITELNSFVAVPVGFDDEDCEDGFSDDADADMKGWE